eukprot:gene36925-19622_t
MAYWDPKCKPYDAFLAEKGLLEGTELVIPPDEAVLRWML